MKKISEEIAELPNIVLRLTSEDVEPTMVKILATLINRVEQAKRLDDYDSLLFSCCHLWYGLEGMNKIAIALTCSRKKRHEADCLHFSIATNNYMRMVRRYIMELVTLDPEVDSPFQWKKAERV